MLCLLDSVEVFVWCPHVGCHSDRVARMCVDMCVCVCVCVFVVSQLLVWPFSKKTQNSAFVFKQKKQF